MRISMDRRKIERRNHHEAARQYKNAMQLERRQKMKDKDPEALKAFDKKNKVAYNEREKEKDQGLTSEQLEQRKKKEELKKKEKDPAAYETAKSRRRAMQKAWCQERMAKE